MYSKLRSLLFSIEAERAHQLAMGSARAAQALAPRIVESTFAYSHPALHISIFGKQFTNPIGLAAGFDKNAKLILFWRKLGFGFIEVGSVSALRSKGNKRPRAFRVTEDHALINRMGLNNDGAAKVASRLAPHAGTLAFPIGVNIAKTHDPSIEGEAAIEDFCTTFRTLAPFADYITLNVSCPNTAEGKTFEDPNSLDELLIAISRERKELTRRVPVLVKFSPPEMDKFVLDSHIDELLLVSLAHKVDGFVASNTASDRLHMTASPAELERIGRGGLSGEPIAKRATQMVRYLYRKTEGKLPIIGVGGVNSGESAYEKIRAGASLVQLYTGLVYGGPGLVPAIKKRLVELLAEDGFGTISQAIGIDT
jgi:dihydroorotate dehydrogenase